MQLPRITINTESRIVVRRTLPTTGEILVQRGQRVEALDVVARAELPRRYRVVDVARRLAQPKASLFYNEAPEPRQPVILPRLALAGCCWK
jgi:hypothetical protein